MILACDISLILSPSKVPWQFNQNKIFFTFNLAQAFPLFLNFFFLLTIKVANIVNMCDVLCVIKASEKIT